jgi:hypothetical protein
MARKTLTGLSPIAEQMVQERMARAAELRIERAMAPELARTYRAMAAAYGNPGEQAAIIAEHGKRVAEILTANWLNIWSQFGRRIFAAVLKSNRGVYTQANLLKLEIEQKSGMAFDAHGIRILSKVDAVHEIKRAVPLTPIFDEARRKWVLLFGAVKVTQIEGTTKEQALRLINQAIADAATQGLDERATAALLRARMAEQSVSLATLRSRVIARTEAHNASTAATQAAAEASEIPMKRQWVAAQSEDRTRDDHRDANGQTVGMYEPFIVGGEELMYPGDPNGSAENVINCRCVCAYIPD